MRKYIPLILMIVPLAAMALGNLIAWPHLPDKVPMHWNFRGEVDAWGSRATIWLLPGVYFWVAGLIQLVTLRLPGSAESETQKDNQKAVNWVMSGMAFLFLSIYAEILQTSLNPGKDFGLSLLTRGLGVFTIFLGYSLRVCKRNSFIGIRTKWTMVSDEIWDKTHKMAAGLYLSAGIWITFFPWLFNILVWVGIIVGVCLIATFVSWRLFKKSQA